MFKPFYVHEHHQPGKLTSRSPRGFTLKVSPDPADPRCVVVQGAWCSNKDEFNKKIGRSLADVAEQKVINKRSLPRLVSEMQRVIYPGTTWAQEQDHYYLLKFVV